MCDQRERDSNFVAHTNLRISIQTKRISARTAKYSGNFDITTHQLNFCPLVAKNAFIK